MIGMLLGEMLQDMGFTMCAVSATEDEAVADAARWKPSFMVVDVHLREGSGISAMQRILRAGPMRHIFMSGASIPAGSGVLQKPFLGEQLERAIQSVVGETAPAG